jgi:hypothetical protein
MRFCTFWRFAISFTLLILTPLLSANGDSWGKHAVVGFASTI